MPELPEVETISRQLNQVLPGKTIKAIKVLREKSFVGEASELAGKTIKQVCRKQKMVVIEFKSGQLILLIHLKMTGQLIYQEARSTKYEAREIRIVGGHPTADWVNALPSKHTRVVIIFTDGSTLYFNDMRVFGWIKAVKREQWTADKRKLPPDVVDKEFTSDYLKIVTKRANKSIKLLLLDQNKIGGMGNIYANDALWLSKVKPTRKANDLKGTEIKLLYNACKQVIGRGIATGGASENTYRHINGLGGKYQEEFLVYKRAGESCIRHGCKGIIKKLKIGGRGTYYCPVCQE